MFACNLSRNYLNKLENIPGLTVDSRKKANYTQPYASPGTSLVLQQKSDKKHIKAESGIVKLFNNGRSDNEESEGRRKGKKKAKKFYKKMLPAFLAFGAMKLVFFHFLIKKALFISFGAFGLSTISFVLASLVALKQFFSSPTHQKSDSNKVEVVHIPIRKHRDRNNKHFESDFDESKLIPVTFEPETTTKVPNFPYKKPTETFISSEEDFKGIYSEGLASDIYESDKFGGGINDQPIEVADLSDDETYNGIYSNKNKFVLKKSDKNHISGPFV